MGQGHTAAEDKISCALHMFSMEVWDVQQLLRFLDEFQSFTSDLGTEVKITDFCLMRERLSSVIPFWLSSRVGRSPLQPDLPEEDEAPTYLNPLQQCDNDSSAFLRNGMPVPGAGHMVHNVIKGLSSAMQHYTQFLEDLKLVERALTHNGRRERIIACCMLGTPFANLTSLISSFSFSLHEERWLAVAAFCAAALKPVAILRMCWSQEAYEAKGTGLLLEREWGEDGHGKRFEPAKFTALLRCPRFRHYHRMVVRLKYLPMRLMGWFDCCPCHAGILATATTLSERRRILKRAGIPSGCCPLVSCLAWWVVDGRLDFVISDLGNAIETDVMDAMHLKNSDGLTTPLSPDDFALIMGDFRAAIAFLQLGFGVRMAWTKILPFILMAIPHPNPVRGVHWAKECIKAYDQKEEAHHHRKSLLFLKPGSPLRSAIDQFIISGEMPLLLRLNTAPFLFVPLGDRMIEREHKYLSDVARPKTGVQAGHAFSIRRLRVIEGLMNEQPDKRELLLQHYAQVRSCKGAILAMGLNHHPLFMDVLRINNNNALGRQVTKVVWGVLEQLVYRRDVAGKHEDFPVAHKTAERDDGRRRARVRGANAAKSVPGSADELFLLNARDHLHARGGVIFL